MRCAILFGIGTHAAKLDDQKGPPVKSHTLLPIEDRPLAVEHDQQRREQHQRQREQQQGEREHDIETPLGQVRRRRMTEPVRKNQPLRLYCIRIDRLRLSLDEVHVIADAYSGSAAAQQFGDRQVAALIRSNDDFPSGKASCAIGDGIRTLFANIELRRCGDTAFAAVIQIRDRDKIPIGFCGRQPGDARRLLAGTQHHDAPFQKIEIGQPRERYPGSNDAQQPCQYRCFCKTQGGSGNIIKSS